jgi:flagellar basal-body rod protein FlgG
MDTSVKMLGTSMKYLQEKLNSSSNNISNSDTPGYKKSNTRSISFTNILSDEMAKIVPNASEIYNTGTNTFNPGIYVDEVTRNFSQGNLVQTDNPLDISIQGGGFFTVSSSSGTAYLRSTSMTVDSSGYLSTAAGERLQGTNGSIYIGSGDFDILNDGTVISGGKTVNILKIVDFSNKESMTDAGNGTLSGGGGYIPADGTVMQGFLESSNVDLTEEMTDLIEISKKFQTNQKLIQMLDEINGLSSNRIGKL